jgi:hypothetical protein
VRPPSTASFASYEAQTITAQPGRPAAAPREPFLMRHRTRERGRNARADGQARAVQAGRRSWAGRNSDRSDERSPTLRRKITVGRVQFTIPAGKATEITFKLNHQGTQLLHKLKRLRVTITVTSWVAHDTAITTTKTITIKAPVGKRVLTSSSSAAALVVGNTAASAREHRPRSGVVGANSGPFPPPARRLASAQQCRD